MQHLRLLWQPRGSCLTSTSRSPVASLSGIGCARPTLARWLHASPCLAEAHPEARPFRIRKLPPPGLRKSAAGQGSVSKGGIKTVSVSEFEQRAAEGTATVEDAANCLISHRAEIEIRPFEERRQACLDERTGGRILSWLLKERDELSQEIYKDRKFCSALMWFAIGEGIEDLIWDWVRIELDQEHAALAMHLLGSLGNAHTDWELHGSPNAILRCFKKAVESVPERYQSTSLIGIGCSVSKKLERPECPPADEDLFQFYLEGTEIFSGKEIGQRQFEKDEYRTSLRSHLRKLILMLYHPSTPNSSALLRDLQEGPRAHRLETHAIWGAKKQSSANTFAIVLLRLSYILRLEGNLSEPQWIDACVKRRAPIVWRGRRSSIKALQQDRKLDGLRERAIERGILGSC